MLNATNNTNTVIKSSRYKKLDQQDYSFGDLDH